MVLVLTELFSRPLLPVDETRYMSVAWEAWVGGDHLVSHLNSERYAHKPPLLFWLINSVWYVFGLNEYAARLVSPFAGIVCLLLTAMMARRLWPESVSFQRCAPMMLLSMTVWIVFCPVTMFDMLLTCFTLLALLGVLRAEAGATKSGWLLVGVALGLGILSKGPIVLVHVMPAALLAPWWSLRVRNRSLRWYIGCVTAIVIAATIGLSWALPSAAAGGEAYSEDLLYGQTTGRIISSFAHRQPFWWYLPVLPLCLTPWILFGSSWRGLKSTRLDSPLKFLVCWAVASLLILSLVSGKQVYYLLPVIPAFALILARLTTSAEAPVSKRDLAWVVAGTIAMGAFPLLANHIPPLSHTRLKDLITDWQAVPLVACGVMLIPFSFRRIESAVFAIGTAAVLFFIIVILSVRTTMWAAFDLRPLASVASTHDGNVAWYGRYHGQLNYLGGIRRIHVARDRKNLEAWLADHREGVLIIRLSAANIDALTGAGTNASSSERLSSAQAQQITRILRADIAFPGHEWQPSVIHLSWIRTGLRFAPMAVVRFENLPGNETRPPE